MELDRHAESEHQLMLFEKAATDVGVEYLQEILLQLFDPPFYVLNFFPLCETLDEQLAEPSHGKLVHRIKLRHLLKSKVHLGRLHSYRFEVLAILLDPLLQHLCRVQLVLNVISNLL